MECLANLVNQYQAILAVFIAIIGWLVTYRLTIRAQERNYVNQIKNDARLKITKALRDYTNDLWEIHNATMFIESPLSPDNVFSKIDWMKEIIRLKNILASKRNLWLLLLEDYEILLPFTRIVREELLERDLEINDNFDTLYSDIVQALNDKELQDEKIKEAFTKFHSYDGFRIDQICLVDDLIVHLQNYCLSTITNNSVPLSRKPKDPSVPLVVKEKGNLKIKYGQK